MKFKYEDIRWILIGMIYIYIYFFFHVYSFLKQWCILYVRVWGLKRSGDIKLHSRRFRIWKEKEEVLIDACDTFVKCRQGTILQWPGGKKKHPPHLRELRNIERESSKSVRTPGSYPGSIGTPGSDFSIYQNPGGLEVPIFLESC